MEFSRPEYWSGNLSLLQGIFPTQVSVLQADSLPAELPGNPQFRPLLFAYLYEIAVELSNLN